MKKLLRIPAIVLFISAFWTWISFDGYLSIKETFLPIMNFQGALAQVVNWVLVCIQGGIGIALWQFASEKQEEKRNEQ